MDLSLIHLKATGNTDNKEARHSFSFFKKRFRVLILERDNNCINICVWHCCVLWDDMVCIKHACKQVCRKNYVKYCEKINKK